MKKLIKLPKMDIYGKYVSRKRASEELIVEKFKYSNEFTQIINVKQNSYLIFFFIFNFHLV